jgi:hypothetical protein
MTTLTYGIGIGVGVGDSVVAELVVVVSDEGVALGLTSWVTGSVLCFPRSRTTRETAGSNKPIRMAIIAITTSNSISVKAVTRSRSFGRVDAEEVFFNFIDNRRCARLAKFPQDYQ